ncbi:hypothetical protein SG0102_00900 [Intestinibaculum porci]|uniref:DUF3784 domain-containing protein n=1 Tax=Intestinibaculum porci TaxID=2487118 RepID=A0A3G9J312_9FIRM|nr:hypothetical protein [Intestinibaculum porci]BBH25156.1 hypothetical protein SG0102_00900 [Intestinibaculum porci]
MGKLILTIGLGAFIVYMGIMIAFKERIDLIHDYHHRYVEEENKPLFCRLVGSGMMIAGIGFAGMGLLSNALGKQGYMISLGLLFLGILIAAITIVKFNAIHQVKDYAKKRERKK